jgi:16S rRNA G1207 methylase RsmC
MISNVYPYVTKIIPFRFRGIDFSFALSYGLFSSADIDQGTRFLLKVFSQILDDDISAGRPLPRTVLDAGCGIGVIGICAAASLMKAAAADFYVRAQDRDDLARAFTGYNALKNNIPPSVLAAYTEPLLGGSADSEQDLSRSYPLPWDLILTNIPAKAGKPVLEDFIRRSAALLNSDGRVIMVAVNTLADFFRSIIKDDKNSIELIQEETGTEHTVFVFTRSSSNPVERLAPVQIGETFLRDYPFYLRTSGDYKIEDELIHIDALHGAPEFDEAGGAVIAAVKLIKRIGWKKLISASDPISESNPNNKSILIHEPGQGFFSAWLAKTGIDLPIVLSSRNILSLDASRRNTVAAQKNPGDAAITIFPVPDLPSADDIKKQFTFIAAFPESIPGTNLHDTWWENIAGLLENGGAVIAALPSSEAERFDRKKPKGFSRLGDIKRNGFRALAYRYE